ncbi:MAG: MBL fold metallo-hydrolase [Myxococcales bacterium]|nr:MBL fold metallo-hydrolase [Myxococcales bacterium]
MDAESRADNAIPVSRDVYWVGFYEETTRLQCNPYVLLDREDVIFFDPGSIPDFPKVMRKVLDLINPHDINWIVVSHQDPDVCGNLAVVEDVIDNPELRIAAHTNTARLINHLGLRSPIHRVDRNGDRLVLRSGRILDFIHLPYLHSPGAIATFDRKNGFLFSGDLFGAISKSDDLFSTAGFPQSLDSFHQAYMPSNSVLRRGLARVERLPISAILPQHGSVIEGENVRVAIEHLRGLPCGEDCHEPGDE